MPHPAQHSWLGYSAGGWQSQRGHMLGILWGEALRRRRWKNSPSGPISWLSCPLRGWIHTPRHSLPAPSLLEGQVQRVGGASTEPSLPGDLRKLTSFQETVSSPVRKGPGVSSSQGGCGAPACRWKEYRPEQGFANEGCCFSLRQPTLWKMGPAGHRQMYKPSLPAWTLLGL